MTTRLSADHRRAQIIGKAVELSRGGGLYRWTLQNVADALEISRPTILYYFGSAQGLRSEIIGAAIREPDLDILTQALTACDPIVEGLDDTLLTECAEHLRDQ